MIDLYSVVSRVSPTKEEEDRIREVTDLAVGRLNAYLRENNINAVPAVVGSSSRNTNLVHSLRSSDVDIFLVFPRDARMEDLKKFGLAAGHHILPEGVEKYAEHPYVNGFINGIKVDIVPCYAMDKGERKISAVDRTVLHDKYLKSVLTDDLRKEIRLFKAFLISAGVYGSEVSKAGFSGLVSELIIVRLGSFLGAVQYFSSRRGNIAIPESDKGIHGFHSPLVVMDPVDDTRNAAAAVSTENMARLKMQCRLFVKNPSESFFFRNKREPVDWRSASDRGTHFRVIEIPRPDEVDDVIYPQANRFRNVVFDYLERAGFLPVSSGIEIGNEVLVLIETERKLLPLVERHTGPPVDSPNSMDFIEKWTSSPDRLRGPYIEGDRLMVERVRALRDLDEAIINCVKVTGIGKHLDPLKEDLKMHDPVKVMRFDELMNQYMSRGIMDS